MINFCVVFNQLMSKLKNNINHLVYHPSLADHFTNNQWCIVVVSHHRRDLANGAKIQVNSKSSLLLFIIYFFCSVMLAF